jgi:plastocyanin
VFYPLDGAPAATRDSAVIDQINKKFVPRVSVVRTGTAITFPNSDRIRHQVYSFSQAKTFSLKLYAGSPKTAVTFDQPGLVVLGCNIHDNMIAFVGVVDSPYFAKTSDTGIASLNLPAGRYRLRAWHPNAVAALPSRDITVASAPLNIPLAIDVDGTSTAVAAWLE